MGWVGWTAIVLFPCVWVLWVYLSDEPHIEEDDK